MALIVKHKKLLIILAVLILLYILIPVLHRWAPPFHLFHLEAEKVTAIEVQHWDEIIRFEDSEKIEQLVDRLNHTCFTFWIPTLPSGGSDYILHIYQGSKHSSYSVGPNYLQDGVSYSANMAFISTDLFSDSMASVQSTERESVAEEASDETQALLAAAEQGAATGDNVFTVENGVLYCNGTEVTEETKNLELENCDIDDYSFLKNYSWVESLLIEDEALVDLDFLRDCTNLKALTLTCGASDFQAIGELSQLLNLNLKSPGLTKLDFLSQLSLEVFVCSYNDNLVDISDLNGMTSLTLLSLLQCGAIEDFSVLSSLTGLEQLALSGTAFEDLTLIESLSSLSNLSVEGCAVDYELLASASYSLKKLGSDADAEMQAWLEGLFPDCEFT